MHSSVPVTDTTAQYLLRLIANGSMDHLLSEIAETLVARRQVTAVQKRAAFKVGDRVVVNERIKPKKFTGLTGVVVGKDAKFVRVDVDPRYHYLMGRYPTTNCGFPPNALDAVAAPVVARMTDGTLRVVR